MGTSFWRGTMGIIVVYDVTNEDSFGRVRYWMKTIEEHASPGVNKILVGTKCDLRANTMIDTARAQRLADEYGMQLFEASAKENINVTELFTQLARDIKHRLIDSDDPAIVDASAHVDLGPNEVEPTQSCF